MRRDGFLFAFGFKTLFDINLEFLEIYFYLTCLVEMCEVFISIDMIFKLDFNWNQMLEIKKIIETIHLLIN